MYSDFSTFFFVHMPHPSKGPVCVELGRDGPLHAGENRRDHQQADTTPQPQSPPSRGGEVCVIEAETRSTLIDNEEYCLLMMHIVMIGEK